ncbi:hypothetical protein RQ734_08495 [Roseomonas mucosa]|uniref:Secreted protein n=1 Tax=Roseomonas mucosa TaxID=207340 RepID=A0A1S8D0L7_9PROT|nr:hypothetical protein [Roseomonas mucosa]MDT8276098.1 hypothetical protein [Roseomonas mucosa]ONH81853.1 hypothetical protein APZ41_017675 [Roseomonas mucosa]
MFRPIPFPRIHPPRTIALATTTLVLLLASTVPHAARAAPSCQVVRFDRGQNGIEIAGMAPARDTLCYALTTAPNQTANLRLTASPNIVLDIPGVAEDQREVTFRTERRTYRIQVGQLARGAYAEPFRLSISLD